MSDQLATGVSEPLGAGMQEPANRNGAFPRLDEDQRARLRAAGTVRKPFLRTGRDVPEEDLAAYGLERPLLLETSRPGIFAVGDVHSGSIKRVASAIGEGSMAIRLVHERLAAR